MIVRANMTIVPQAIGENRSAFVVTVGQIKNDIATCEKMGADEAFLEPAFCAGRESVSRWLELLEEFQPAQSAAMRI
jgi:hypothetical protein